MRGVFLSLDSIAAMLLLFIVVLISFSYVWAPKSATYESLSLRASAQDAATVMEKLGYLPSPLESANSSGTQGISEVISSLPSSVCMAVASYGEIVSEGLEGYWKLNEAFGSSAADHSQNGFTGSLKGGASFIDPGLSGSSVSFDGEDESQVDTAQSTKLEPQKITVSAWVKPHEDGAEASLVERAGGYGLGLDLNSKPTFWINVGGSVDSISAPNTVQPGRWTHISGTFDNTTRNLSIYVDGNLSNSAINANNLVYGTPGAGKTAAVTLASDPFDGELDDIRIYSRALEAWEVAQIYSNKDNLLYVIEMPGCLYSGGEIQSVVVPFAHNANQNENKYYHAVIKAWFRGTRQ